MRAIVVRHGESEGNQQGVIQGRLDSALTARGHRQIMALAEALADLPVSKIYTSPALRAQSTARLLAGQFSCSFTVDERLHERHFGLFQGRKAVDVQRESPELFNALFSGDPLAVIPQGESTENVSNRLFACLKELHGGHQNDTVIIVSHGHALEVIVWQLKGGVMNDDLRQYGHQNCSYSILNVDAERLELVKWGVSTHLRNIR